MTERMSEDVRDALARLSRFSIYEVPLGEAQCQTFDIDADMGLILTYATEQTRRAEAAEERLAAYIGARDFDGGCLCDQCVAAITRRLNCADDFTAARAAIDNEEAS